MSEHTSSRAKETSVATHQIFGQNLRELITRHGTIAAVCRDLDVNRVQMGRFLNGESFPKPGLLKRLCAYFDVDARILLERLEDLERPQDIPKTLNDLTIELHERNLPEVLFNITNVPPGVHVMYRQSYMRPNRYMKFLCHISKHNGVTLIRGNESRLDWDTMKHQSRYPFSGKEWTGLAYRGNEGFCYVYKDDFHDGVMGFGYFAEMGTFTDNIFLGVCTVLRRSSPNYGWTVPSLLHILPQTPSDVMSEARSCGLYAFGELPNGIETAFRMCITPRDFNYFTPKDE